MKIKELYTGLTSLRIPTRDLDDTILFYNELGFQITLLTTDPGTESRVAFLRFQDLMIEGYETEEIPACPARLTLWVSDIEETYDTICNRVLNNLDDVVHSLPYWENGIRFFTIEGPSGEKVAFCQQL